MYAKNVCVSGTWLPPSRSWDISSHLTSLSSITCSRLQVATCSDCRASSCENRCRLLASVGHSRKAADKSLALTRNALPSTCIIVRVGLLVNPAVSGSPMKPSFPHSPTSTLFPSPITLKIEASPSLTKNANLIRSPASFKTMALRSETNVNLEKIAAPSLGGRPSSIVFLTACPLRPLGTGSTAVFLLRALSVSDISASSRRTVRFRKGAADILKGKLGGAMLVRHFHGTPFVTFPPAVFSYPAAPQSQRPALRHAAPQPIAARRLRWAIFLRARDSRHRSANSAAQWSPASTARSVVRAVAPRSARTETLLLARRKIPRSGPARPPRPDAPARCPCQSCRWPPPPHTKDR